MSTFFTVFIVAVVFFIPIHTGFAQDRFGVEYGTASGLSTQDVRATIAKIIQVALGILGTVFLGLIVYSGFSWMTAGGDDKKVEEAKKMIINATIGLIVIFLAFAITTFVIRRLEEATITGIGNGGGDPPPPPPCIGPSCNGGGCTGAACGYCNNNIIDPGEQCDGTIPPPNLTCTTPGQSYQCNNCLITGCGTGTCNNDNVADNGEQCDGADLRGLTCTGYSPSFTGGTLGCSACIYDTRGCTGGSGGGLCNNSVIDAGEQCDGPVPPPNGLSCNPPATGSWQCSVACQLTGCTGGGGTCPNGIVEGSEQCDGNTMSCQAYSPSYTGGTVACTSSCAFDTSGCTSGGINPPPPGGGSCNNDSTIDPGEQCDGPVPPPNGLSCNPPAMGSWQCDSSCQLTGCTGGGGTCPNGIVEGSEQCDGNTMSCQAYSSSYSGGVVACTSSCVFDTSGCTTASQPPLVVENGSCNATSIQSPTPSRGSADACANANIGVSFNQDMDDVSLGGITVQSCGTSASFDAAQCSASVSGTRSVITLAGGDAFLLTPSAAALDTGRWYQAIVPITVRSAAGVSIASEYRWNFRVAGVCTPNTLNVTPATALITTAGGTQQFVAVASGSNCNLLRDAITYSWSTSDTAGAFMTLAPASDRATATARAQTGATPVQVKAEITGVPAVSGTAQLTIQFTGGGGGTCNNNNTVEPGEQCDGPIPPPNLSCTVPGQTYQCTNCTITGCGSGACNNNNIAEAGEQCDGSDLNGLNCPGYSPTFSGGTLTCTPFCTFDTRACTVATSRCNNNIIDPGEQCDGPVPPPNGLSCNPPAMGSWQCDSSCQLTGCTGGGGTCPNGIVEGSEQCDGNTMSCQAYSSSYTNGTVTCSPACTFDTSGCAACTSPWPGPSPYTDSAFGFSFWYCRDGGNLPALNTPVTTTSTPDPDVLKEYLFLRPAPSKDAVGLKVFRLGSSTSLNDWYSNKVRQQGSPSSTTVNGQPALREGRTVYVLASNPPYVNVYVISYSDGADGATVQIFEEIVKNWIFQ